MSSTNNELNLLSKNIAAIYPLVPIQQGMLFHTLMDQHSGMYLQQNRLTMVMEDLNVDAFFEAWQQVVNRHDILRTAFVHNSTPEPLQVVLKTVTLPCQYIDWQSLTTQEQNEKLEQLLAEERTQGLAFNQAPMMSIRLIKLAEDTYQFIRSYHHILMDAWCFSILMTEFLQLYRAISENKTISLPKPASYQQYIHWLTHQESDQHKGFWQEKLIGFNTPTTLGIEQTDQFSYEKNIDESNDSHKSANVSQNSLSQDVVTQLTQEQTQQLQQQANKCSVTLNTVLQGAWALTLAKYSGCHDVVFGITVAGRSAELAGIDSMVGLFINTLPLRCNTNANQTLQTWLQQIQHNNLALREREHVSLAQIQQWSEVDNDDLFRSIFVYENTPLDAEAIQRDFNFTVETAQNRSNLNYPLTVTVIPQACLQLELTYATKSFEHVAVENMLHYFRDVLINLSSIVSNTEASPTDASNSTNIALSNTTLSNITPAITASKVLTGEQKTIPDAAYQLFSQQAKANPHATAIVFNKISISYEKLEQYSNALAHYLVAEHSLQAKSKAGSQTNSLVGLYMDRSIDMVIAMLAIHKAGGAYVPLDPEYPTARLTYIAQDTKLTTILTQAKGLERLNNIASTACLDFTAIAIDKQHSTNIWQNYPNDCSPTIKHSVNDLAYIIYTSGSTGQPKGVMIEHKQLSNFLVNVQSRYQLCASDRVLQFSTINFDISVEEVFGALCHGASLILRDEACLYDPLKFHDFCQTHEISVISLPTAFWHQLVAYPDNVFFSSLRLTIVGGEALQPAMVSQWLSKIAPQSIILMNTYGPTEATVTATSYVINANSNLKTEKIVDKATNKKNNKVINTTSIPIGHANPNTELLILDDNQQPVPIGVIGELYIGGDSVARGYLNQPTLTEERFISLPHLLPEPLSSSLSRYYRTGDLVRNCASGELEFIGRIDDQIKIRGYRVELGEIETAILQHQGVKQCVVTYQNTSTLKQAFSEKTLIAYIVPNDSIYNDNISNNISNNSALEGIESTKANNIDQSSHLQELPYTLQQELQTKLADYMVPTNIICLASLALTANGKIDKKALLAVEDSHVLASLNNSASNKTNSTHEDIKYAAPISATEIMLSDIWKKVLKLSEKSQIINRTDNFFHLGGHSLLVIQVLSHLRKSGVVIEAPQLFKTPTLSALANAIDNRAQDVLNNENVEQQVSFTPPKNLIPLNCQQLTAEMLSMVSLSAKELEHITNHTNGGANNIQDIYPLAPLQEGILFHHMVDPSNDPYVVSALIAVDNGDSFEQFVEGLKYIINRHDVLRTAILWKNLPTPLQVVNRHCELSITWLDLTNNKTNSKHDTRSIIEKMAEYQHENNHVIDLEQASLLRLVVAKDQTTGQHAVLFLEHHIIADHVSVELLIQELAHYLNKKLNNKAPILSQQLPKSVPYRNFVAFALQQSKEHNATDFFTDMLSGIEQATTPFNLTNIQGNGDQIIDLSTPLTDTLSNAIRKQAIQLSTSPAVLFHAAWAMVVGQCSRQHYGKKDKEQNEFVFGTVMSGRLQNIENIDAMLGMFINTLPVRVNLTQCSVQQLIQNMSESLQALIPYEQTSLALAQQCSGLSAEQPLFSALLNYRHSQSSNLIKQNGAFNGFSLEQVEERSNYPFGLSVDDFGDRFELTLEIDQSVSARKITDYVINALTYITDNLASENHEFVNTFSVLTNAEKNQQLNEWALPGILTTPSTLKRESTENVKTLAQFVTAQAQCHPQNCALIYQDKEVSYLQLEQQANQLAHLLKKRLKENLQENTQQQLNQEKNPIIIGLCLDKSINMVISILAVLKIGCAYLPIDPKAPIQRQKFQFNDANVPLIITQRAFTQTDKKQDASQAINTIVIDDNTCQQQLAALPVTLPTFLLKSLFATTANNIDTCEETLAYVLYTSGTTGQPKGVMVNHAGVVNLIKHQSQTFNLSPDDVFIWLANYVFDASIEQLFSALANGACLVIPNNEDIQQPDAITALINRYQVTHLDGTPSYLTAISNNGLLPSVKRVIAGGESLTTQLREHWGDKIINVYGPTEASITAIQTAIKNTYYIEKNDYHDNINTIGKPISNTFALVLDANLNLLPQGVAGELYLGGIGLAQGYLNQPQLTNDAFIDNPYTLPSSQSHQKRLYKTGDLVAWQPDGQILFLGRVDHQVNIRGVRIELAEVEQQLLHHDDISEILVTVVDRAATTDNQLVAYIVGDTLQQSMLIERFIDFSAKHLPSAMVPQHWVIVSKMPLSATGKIDKKALPEINTLQPEHYIAPQTNTEIMLAALWEDILSVKKVSRHDNFFELGGHSLLIMQMITALQQRDIHVTAKQLFTQSVLSVLASEIDGMNHGAVDADKNNTDIINKDKGANSSYAFKAQGFRAHPSTAQQFKAPENKIPASGANTITPDMLSMITLSEAQLQAISERVIGGASNIQDIYPLAPLQEGILFHHMIDPENDPYVMPAYLRIKGTTAYLNFIEGIKQVIQRHDVLRTAVLWRNMQQPLQVVYRNVVLPITELTFENNEDFLVQMQRYTANNPVAINIEQAPLLELTVVHHKGNDEYVIRILDHHIVSDHVGMEIIQQELALIFTQQSKKLLLPVQYREFVAHAHHQAQHSNAQEFFTELLSEIDESTLAFNLADTQHNGQNIDEQERTLPHQLSTQLRQQARQLHMSPAALFHSALAMVVSLCSDRNDIVFGTVMSGRLQGVENAASMMGMFINTLPLRVNLTNSNATSLVEQVHNSLLDLLPYEQASLALAQRCSSISNESSNGSSSSGTGETALSTPLFNTLLNYRHTRAPLINEKSPKEKLVNEKLTNISTNAALSQLKFISPQERSNYPLSIAIDDYGDDFLINVQVDKSVDAQNILDYLECALTLLTQQLSVNSTSDILQQSILSSVERQRILSLSTSADLREPLLPITQSFNHWVKTTPTKTALRFGNESLSYQALDQQSTQLAHYLLSVGVKANNRVGICLNRSMTMVVTQLALFKMGAAYVPLDPSFPKERLHYTISNSQISHMISETQIIAEIAELFTDVSIIEIDNEVIKEAINKNISQCTSKGVTTALPIITTNHLAYIIYTSGSTGQPKGVEISQHAFANFLTAMNQQVNHAFGNDCRLLAITTTAFDIAGLEIFGPLVQGGEVVIASKEDSMSVKALTRLIEHHNINCLQATPATWQMLAAQNWQGKTDLIALCGGEPLPQKLAQYIKPRCKQLWNCYGPTEATVWSLVQEVTTQQLTTGITIGQGLPNYQHLVLNNAGQLVPQGTIGELVISSISLADGYYQQPEKTAEVFTNSILAELPEQRLYRTGDLVRQRLSGEFEFIGRCDEQVKIRGFRIELGEIQQQILAIADAELCHVIVREDQENTPLIVAYLSHDANIKTKVENTNTSKSNDNSLTLWPELVSTIKQYLQQHLPEYMIPSAFVAMEEWPLTPNGKVDKKSLPKPDLLMSFAQFTAPETESECKIADIWAELLLIDAKKISIDSNFFELGGHSLLAMQLISKIEHQFQLSLSLQILFKSPTIRAICGQLNDNVDENDDALDFMNQLLNEFEEEE